MQAKLGSGKCTLSSSSKGHIVQLRNTDFHGMKSFIYKLDTYSTLIKRPKLRSYPNQIGGNGRVLMSGEGKCFGELFMRRVTAQVAIDIEGEGLLAVERVGIVEVEFRRDIERLAVLVVADVR